jgi:hypothetical protein
VVVMVLTRAYEWRVHGFLIKTEGNRHMMGMNGRAQGITANKERWLMHLKLTLQRSDYH